MDITTHITSLTSRLKAVPEITPNPPGFLMFNDGGVEVEIAEFLYSLVRMMKPEFILETGTHKGISSTYMGMALERNTKGHLWTFEILPELLQEARALWTDTKVSNRVVGFLQSSLQANISKPIDILFLDSEPQLRFDEFVRYWPQVVPGGMIMIHDLHRSMGHHGQVMHGQYDWPYGDFRPKLGPYILSGDVQLMHFPTPRGFTIFQKADPQSVAYQYARGNCK